MMSSPTKTPASSGRSESAESSIVCAYEPNMSDVSTRAMAQPRSVPSSDRRARPSGVPSEGRPSARPSLAGRSPAPTSRRVDSQNAQAGEHGGATDQYAAAATSRSST